MLKIYKVVLALLSVATLSVAADNAFLSKSVKLFKNKDKKEILGELVVASEVKVLKKIGKLSKVEFIGYAPEDSPTVYEKAGFLITGFEGDDFSKYKVIGKKVDEYDTEWFQVSIIGFVPSEVLNDKNNILASGESMFNERCGACHDIHHKEEFIPNVWPSILDNMAAQAGLTKDERMKIEKFLQEQ